MPIPAPHSPGSSASLAERLALILGALRQAAAARAARHWAAAPLVLLLWAYLNRLATRFVALAGRLHAGRLVARSQRADTVRTPSSRRFRLPRGAWLLRLVPETIALRGQLEHLMADPDMATLLATAPHAARLLRPLCRMLGLSPGPALPRPARRRSLAPPSPCPPTRPPATDDAARLEHRAGLPAARPAPA